MTNKTISSRINLEISRWNK